MNGNVTHPVVRKGIQEPLLVLQVTPDMPQPGNLQKVEALRQAVSRSTSRVLRIPRLRHMRSKMQYMTSNSGPYTASECLNEVHMHSTAA